MTDIPAHSLDINGQAPADPSGDPSADSPVDAQLAYQQSLKYGKDLARVYVAEKEKRERLEVAYQMLSAVFASTPDGLIVLDDALAILQANTAFERMVEAPPKSLVGKAISDILLSEKLISAIQELTRNSAAPTQLDLTLTHPIRRAMQVNIARLQAGRLRGWVITFHDQSERKRIEYQKSEFINIAAHELRTPLTAVMGYTELLSSGLGEKLDPGDRDLLDAIIKGAQRLERIVNELIQFAIISSGQLQTSGDENIRLLDVASDIESELEQRIMQQRLEAEIDIPDFIYIGNDPSKLRTALYQIILNAINFNRPNGYIRVEAFQDEQGITIDIKDSGIGIAKTDLDVIFQPFFQVEDHSVRHMGGLGLGLSIARRAILELNGNINVTSVLDQGTTFTVHIPLQKVEQDKATVTDLKTELASTREQSMVYARDIQALYTRLQQTYGELQEVAVQLEEANTLKSNFLGVVGHELRSPFVSIDLALQAFARYGEGTMQPEQRELFDQMVNGFKEGRHMIDSLVNYAGLLSKQGRLNYTPVDLEKLINESAETLRTKAEAKGLTWTVQVPHDLVVQGDRERLTEAVWHLMSNAIKYTKQGEVIIRAYSEDNSVSIEVKDTGVGIPIDQQDRIWEAFRQMADPLKRGVEGLGLGLALVRYVALAHGGNVILHSVPNVGSVVGFWVPIVKNRTGLLA